ncbi:transcription factor GTE12-like isoform X1 [Juglans microcarpa x Juglans regia]|uniref:transcription factor GTE12-like isoform X1 n=1 Tax=Juglans microcarpa x Juglans regia TaxID=2249226 RepID=UPI001B7EA1B7|nr:transcription factor GTE12-like isoform X1 [Juglans microcarpa x Juglans regia]XP_041026495.1 transcription factor GTE12-like isoform X1 [Juglans microcarpa x Juglans regia]
MIATETLVSSNKSGVQVSRKRKQTTSDKPSCKPGQPVPFTVEGTQSSTSDGRKKLEKRQRMDPSVTSRCSMILKTLMTHPVGWVFNQPVDPVALNIPDYLSIISNPMDLGTVKSKLEHNMYFSTEEFAADIRLTFSNAMLYNPADNSVYKMAVKLNKIFEKRWDPLELTKTGHNCTRKSSGEDFQNGIDSHRRNACGSANAKFPLIAHKCSGCGSIICHCSLPCDLTHASSSDLSSERSLDRDHHVCSVDVSRQDCQEKRTSVSQVSKSDVDSDGTVSALDYENACHISQSTVPSTDAVPKGEGYPPIVDVQLSPKKALRVAMMKSRFAETILKAQQKTQLDQGNKADLLRILQEKERLGRRQQEEIGVIKAQIRAAETVTRIKEESLKQQWEREREAMRAALQKMKKTVDFGDSLWTQKEFDALIGSSAPHHGSLVRQ